MSLLVTHLEIEGFRSYKKIEVEPDPRLTVFVGANAVGKTNLIEALQLLTAAESFRKPFWAETVNWESEAARLSITAQGEGRILEVYLTVNHRGKREYRINGKPRHRLVDVVGVLPSVTFTPDDLRLVKDSAEKRRNALDSLGSQLSPAYSRAKNEYEKVVKQRNALLRLETNTLDELEIWTERLIEVGARFFDARKRLFRRLYEAMVVAHSEIAEGSDLRPVYQASWERDALDVQEDADTAEKLRTALRLKKKEERVRRTTLIGPHRDDIVFLVEKRDARAYASQGQQRTVALAWKIAEVTVIKEVSEQPPILLLDDVMSELDEARRDAMTQFVGTVAQTFVTTTNTGYFDRSLLERACLVRLG